MTTSPLIERLESVQKRITSSCDKYGRARNSVKLLAVSKRKPISDIKELAAHGHLSFGENYVQEALDKIEQAPHLEWHFIGPIQSNKTKRIAQSFHWVHSVDRIKIAKRLNDQRPNTLAPLKILLEVNISEQPSKAGFRAEEVLEAIQQIAPLPNVELKGLMAIPQLATDFESQRKPLAQMKTLLIKAQKAYPHLTLDTLSMGMSSDLEAAIAEGATMVRIGTDIFGARDD